MFRNTKRFTAILIVLILAASTYAFAAANTIGTSNAGYGTKAVTGYAINDITYVSSTLDDEITSITMKFSDGALPATMAEKPTTILLSTVATHAPADFTNAVCGVVGGVAGVNGTRATPWAVTCNLTTPVLAGSIAALTIVASSSTNFVQVP